MNMTNWKSFEKEMPELGQEILVYGFREEERAQESRLFNTIGGEYKEGIYLGQLNFNDGYGITIKCDSSFKLSRFSYWMPLPDAPMIPKNKYKQIVVEVEK
jgi:hypothetical protein